MDYIDVLLKELKISAGDVAEAKRQVRRILEGLQLI